MEFDKRPWLGTWDNFETYIYSKELKMELCWDEAERAFRKGKLPLPQIEGVKLFWAKACDTISKRNKVRLTGWDVDDVADGIRITWYGESNLGEVKQGIVNPETLAVHTYRLDHIMDKFLEGKRGYVFVAVDGDEESPFRTLIAMSPMEEGQDSKIIPHLHFQYGKTYEGLVPMGHLRHKFWYATMCKGNSTLLEKCNIVRALHKLELW